MTTTKKTSRGLGFLLALVISFTGMPAFGQNATATISGTVRDEADAVVQDVNITIRSIATGRTRSTKTDAEGRYSFSNMEPGNYELRAARNGFKSVVQSVVLTVGGSPVIDISLPVGAVSDEILVQEREPLIESTKAEVSRVVGTQEIESLPIVGRNFVDFVKLSSGVAPGRENVGGGAFKEPDAGVGSAAAPRLTFGGLPELNTMIQVDGVDNVQTFTGLPRATPSQEAAQEFRVLNSTYLAEYGRALGGFVNIVTKSGSNAYHGSFYYFGMNDALAADPILTGPNPALRQNQYGATIGGPIKKERVFFFANYEGQRRAEANKFSQVIFDNLAGINATKIGYGLTPEVTSLLRSNDYDGFLAKMDYSISANNNFSVRYNLLDSGTNGFLGGGGRASPASTTARNNDVFDQALVIGDTAVLSPTLVNEARFQWARRSFDFESVLKEPDLEVSNLLITGKSTSDVDFYRESRFQLSDTLSKIYGNHQLKFGADFNNIRNNSRWDLFFPARVIFPTLTAFLTATPAVFWWPLLSTEPFNPGVPIPFTIAVPPEWEGTTLFSINHNQYGFFAQDQWKATPKLTLTYGLRYDSETYGGHYLSENDLNNFQPRLGIAYAYSPRGVVRAGFGIFNDRIGTSVGQVFNTTEWTSTGDRPNAQTLFPGIAPIHGRFFQPTVAGPGAPAALNNFLATGVPPVVTVINPGFSDSIDSRLRSPYSEQASLEISQEVGGGFVFSAHYLYVHGLKIISHTPNINGFLQGALPSGKPIIGPLRQFIEVGDLFVKDNSGYSIYHGGTFEIEKRFSHGVGLHGSYTFSKTISNSDALANLADLSEGLDQRLERAVSRQHVGQRFTLAFLSKVAEDIPVLKNFKFSVLTSLESGRRFNVFAGSDANRDGNPTSDRPGNLGRNTIRGPRYASVDLRVARELSFTERLKGEISVDFFNLFNRKNIKDLNTLFGGIDLSLPPNPTLGFGTPRDAFNPFQLQFGFKLRF
jgi:outer membrane receptor protein involved in Fe transport